VVLDTPAICYQPVGSGLPVSIVEGEPFRRPEPRQPAALGRPRARATSQLALKLVREFVGTSRPPTSFRSRRPQALAAARDRPKAGKVLLAFG